MQKETIVSENEKVEEVENVEQTENVTYCGVEVVSDEKPF